MNMQESEIKEQIAYVFDNKGKTFDRYTILMADGSLLGASTEPQHPQGFGQYCGNILTDRGWTDTIESFKERNLGDLITYEELPKKVKEYIQSYFE